MAQIDKYDRKRLEQGGKSVFSEILNLAASAKEVKEEFPEVTTAKAVTIAMDKEYPVLKRNISYMETGAPSEKIDKNRKGKRARA